MPDKKLQDISTHMDHLEKVCTDNSAQLQAYEKIQQATQTNHFDLGNRVQEIQENVSVLSGKFDIWQSTVEPMLATAQTSVNHSTYILTGIGIILALAIIWVAKNKTEAIKDARDDLVKEVMNSPKFQKVLREAIAYKMQAESAEESRASRTSSQSVELSGINSAEQSASDENGEHTSEIHDKMQDSKKGGAA
jgi:hypothetical protein